MEHTRRLLSALVLLPPLILFLLYASELVFLLLICVLIGLSLHEYFRMLKTEQLPVCERTVYVLSCALAGTGYWAAGQGLSLMLFLSLVVLTCSVIVTSQEVSQFFSSWLHGTFGLIFIGWCLSHLVLLRGLPHGQWYVLFLCIVVWSSDSVAMYVGKTLGHHKLCPLLSPGKTWEGALGGTLGGVLAALLSSTFLLPHFSPGHSLLVGFVITITAQVSDLGESMVKRYTRVKDSGSLIPGHGGLFDRIDSMIFAAPTLVYTLELLFNLAAA